MSNLFGNLTTEGLEQSGDRLGGYSVLDTDAYPARITLAYATKSEGGAQGIVLEAQLTDGGREYRQTLWVTDRNGKNFYERDGKKNPLPGFTVVDELCLVTTGFPLSQQATEEKVVKVYDFQAKAEVPKAVQVLTGMLGKFAILGIEKKIEDKNVKDPAGKYVPSGETRETNEIAKVFHYETKATVSEIRGEKTPEFHDKWVEKNKGSVRNNAKGAAGKAGAPSAANKSAPQAGAPSAASLFNKG
jgi:hypothetical protein